MTFTVPCATTDTSGPLIALKAQAYLNRMSVSAHGDMSEALTDGLALVSALLSAQDSADVLQENKRKLANQVLEKMHLVARETVAGGRAQAFPCFSC